MDCIFEDDSAISEEGFEEKILKELEEFSDDDAASMNQSYASIKAVNQNMRNFFHDS